MPLIGDTVEVLSIHQHGHNQYSNLWGEDGEQWSPQSYLPDFSYAGYHHGEEPLPKINQCVSIVDDFGAKGDGRDSSQAFLDAIEVNRPIYIPSGRYKITKIIESKVSLIGEDPDKTVLYFPNHLTDIKPDWKITPEMRISNYSWSGGFIWIKGNFEKRFLTSIIAEAKRGEDSLIVSSADELRVGQRIEIKFRRKSNSLVQYLYSGDSGDTDNWKDIKVSLVCRITEVKGNLIIFDRPLRFDVKLEWLPEVYQFNSSVTKISIENLCFEFPNTLYDGHFSELGYNALALSNVSDCWVRNIKIVNADSGIFIDRSKFCTIQNIIFESNRKGRDNCVGHHGIYLQGDDNLFTNFEFKVQFIHDISVSNCSGNVCCDGRGINLCFDHHKKAPYENLFTNIDAGLGSRMWISGGGEKLGRHCGARGTFWNIRSKNPQKYPIDFGPNSVNLVAIKSESIYPQNIYRSQLARRLRR